MTTESGEVIGFSQGRELTQAEIDEYLGIQTAWAWIKEVREKCRFAEALINAATKEQDIISAVENAFI